MRQNFPQYKDDNDNWIMIEDVSVMEDFEATQTEDGIIYLSKTIKDYTINFPSTGKTKYLRLTAHQADLGKIQNFILTEVIITGRNNLN